MSKVIGFKWIAASDDDCFHDASKKAFTSQEDCYNDMMVHAVDKMKWNIEWGDLVERPVQPTENGLITKEQTGFNIGYTLDCHPDKIVHKSYSGEYTYQILPIAVDEDEAERLKIVEEWITRKDGMDGAIGNITNIYTICDDANIWEEFAEEWDSLVPACPSEIRDNLADMVLNMHLEIQKIADDINRKIADEKKQREATRYTKIIAEYLVNGEKRAYVYCLGDVNDCNHYFDDEESLIATFVLVDKGESEEDYYLQTPIEDVTSMVKNALEYLEENARK